MKKKVEISLTFVVLSLIVVVIFCQNPKQKTDRKQRKVFKDELLTYQHNIDFSNYDNEEIDLSFLNIDIATLFNEYESDFYFDEEEFGELKKDIEDITYDEYKLRDFVI